MTRLEVTIREGDGRISVALAGELDLSEAPRVEAELRAIEERDPATLVLDLRALSFLDSSGLRLVLEADQRAREAGRKLVVVKGPDAVHRVFEIALLDQRLDFVDEPGDGPPEAGA